jgi:hypothetical protein
VPRKKTSAQPGPKSLQKPSLAVAAACDRRDFEGISPVNGAHRAPLQDFCRDFGPLYKIPPPRALPSRDKDQGGDFVHARPIPTAPFTLHEDGSIQMLPPMAPARADSEKKSTNIGGSNGPKLAFADPDCQLWLYHGNCLELLDAIAAKYPAGRFDAIFADPPYFLSNGGQYERNKFQPHLA